MSRLNDAVPAGSAPANDPEVNEQIPADKTPEAKGNDGEGGADDKTPDRSIENVRGELLRKMEQSQEVLLAKIESALANKPAPEPVAKPSEERTLNDLSILELEAMRPNVPEDKQAEFDRYIIDRKVDEKIDKRMGAFDASSQYKAAEAEANKTAFDRWPQLHNQSSELYIKADRILNNMGKSADKNPRAVLDAANEAGLELGLTPGHANRTPRREPSERVAKGRSTRPVKTEQEGADISTEEHKAIQRRLGAAMPGGKFSKANLKSVAERKAMYDDNIDLYKKG